MKSNIKTGLLFLVLLCVVASCVDREKERNEEINRLCAESISKEHPNLTIAEITSDSLSFLQIDSVQLQSVRELAELSLQLDSSVKECMESIGLNYNRTDSSSVIIPLDTLTEAKKEKYMSMIDMLRNTYQSYNSVDKAFRYRNREGSTYFSVRRILCSEKDNPHVKLWGIFHYTQKNELLSFEILKDDLVLKIQEVLKAIAERNSLFVTAVFKEFGIKLDTQSLTLLAYQNQPVSFVWNLQNAEYNRWRIPGYMLPNEYMVSINQSLKEEDIEEALDLIKRLENNFPTANETKQALLIRKRLLEKPLGSQFFGLTIGSSSAGQSIRRLRSEADETIPFGDEYIFNGSFWALGKPWNQVRISFDSKSRLKRISLSYDGYCSYNYGVQKRIFTQETREGYDSLINALDRSYKHYRNGSVYDDGKLEYRISRDDYSLMMEIVKYN